MRIAILFISIVLLFTSCDYGHNAHRTVIDGQTKQILAKVNVVSPDGRFNALTDSNGYFADTFLYGKTQPVMPVSFTKDGYQPFEIPDVFAIEKPIKLVKIPPPSFDTVYGFVEKMPEFIGGLDALNLYMVRNFIYPSQNETQMSFTASFIIDTSGNIISPQVVNPRYTDRLTPAEKEFLRVIRLMPAWVPGEHEGKKVNVKMVLPLKF